MNGLKVALWGRTVGRYTATMFVRHRRAKRRHYEDADCKRHFANALKRGGCYEDIPYKGSAYGALSSNWPF